MDKIQKFLKKLSPKERQVVKDVIELILAGGSDSLDTKKLRGYADIFRVRKGNIRIIYRKIGSEIRLLAIDNRDEDTYKNF